MLDVDYQQLLNAVHVPEDAGEHAEALQRILLRIPDGWGRWISCDRGWYPLLVELDAQLRTPLPNYVFHQVRRASPDGEREFTVPTDAPEAGGTLSWNSTTIVAAEAHASSRRSLVR